MNLLLLDENDRIRGESFRIMDGPDGRLRHLRTILKIEPGQVLRAGLLSTAYGEAHVTEITNDAVYLEARWNEIPPPRPDIDVLLALPRPRLVKRLLPELTALGLRRLIFTATERVEKAYFGATALRSEVYRPFLLEGLAQARLVHLPSVDIDRHFLRFIEEHVPKHYAGHDRLAAHPSASTDLACTPLSFARPILIAIGPEGGFIESEIEALAAAGFSIVHMSQKVLRVETACVAMLAQVDLLRRQHRVSLLNERASS